MQDDVACDGERYTKKNLTNYFTLLLTPANRLKVEMRYKIIQEGF
jgi:Trp operon repressor